MIAVVILTALVSANSCDINTLTGTLVELPHNDFRYAKLVDDKRLMCISFNGESSVTNWTNVKYHSFSPKLEGGLESPRLMAETDFWAIQGSQSLRKFAGSGGKSTEFYRGNCLTKFDICESRKIFAVANRQRDLSVVDLESRKTIKEIPHCFNSVGAIPDSVVFSAGGDLLAITFREIREKGDPMLIVYETQTWKPLLTADADGRLSSAAIFNPTRPQLLLYSLRGKGIVEYNAETKESLVIHTEDGDVQQFSNYSSDGKRVVACTKDNTFLLVERNRVTRILRWGSPHFQVYDFSLSPDGRFLSVLLYSKGNHLRVFRLP